MEYIYSQLNVAGITKKEMPEFEKGDILIVDDWMVSGLNNVNERAHLLAGLRGNYDFTTHKRPGKKATCPDEMVITITSVK